MVISSWWIVDKVGLLFTILVAKSKGVRLIMSSSPYMYLATVFIIIVLFCALLGYCYGVIAVLLCALLGYCYGVITVFLLCFVQLERASVTL